MNRDVTLRKKRSLISGLYAVEYHLTQGLPPFSLPYLIDSILRTVLPDEARHSGSIIDLKGLDRPRSGLHHSAAPAEELLFLSGHVPDPAAEEQQRFDVTLLSRFSAFQGSHHVVHSVEEKRCGEIPACVVLQTLGRAFPLHIETFRLGLEAFTSRAVMLLGFTPSVTQSLSLNCDRHHLELRLSGEKLRNVAVIPFEQYGIFERLDETLRKILGFSLKADYLGRTTSKDPA